MEQILKLDLTQEYKTEKGFKVSTVGSQIPSSSYRGSMFVRFSDGINRYSEGSPQLVGTVCSDVINTNNNLVLLRNISPSQYELF
jgi:hypothetical protein